MVTEIGNHMETSKVDDNPFKSKDNRILGNVESLIENSNATIETLFEQSIEMHFIQPTIPSIEIESPTPTPSEYPKSPGGQSDRSKPIETQNPNLLMANPPSYQQDFAFENYFCRDQYESTNSSEADSEECKH